MASEELNWYKASDPESGCSVFLQQLADGRYAVQFDEAGEVIFKTEAELREIAKQGHIPPKHAMSFVAFELLRRHVNDGEAHLPPVPIS